ncbi:MAG TPA: vitamin K epoxide reductase family protein [Planctomycetaceae bacterium]|nr:vitamin K epoxide reductase family protein [Planctomycetaceae bacterium]
MAATFESFKHPSPLAIDFPVVGAGRVPQSRPFTWLLRGLCCVALSVTGYLVVTALRAGDVAGCGGGAVWDCDVALHSRWAKVLSLPVSVPAFGLYAVLLTSLAFCRPTVSRSGHRLAWGIVTAGAFAAGLAAIWFIGLQVFAVGHLCIYCISAHLCGLALSVAILWRRPMGGPATAKLAGVAVMGVSLLIATQVFSAPPQTYVVEHYDLAAASADRATGNSSAPNKPVADAKGQTKAPAAVAPPKVFEAPTGVPDDSAEN